MKSTAAKSIAAIMSVGVLSFGLTACGDGGGDGGDGADEAREELADALSGEGFDEACVRDNVDDLSDDDARLLAANIDSEEIPEDASEAALEFVETVFECFDLDIDLGELEQ